MRFSEAYNRQVVATTTATTLGHVEGFVVEPAPGRVTALRLGGGKHQTLLSYGDLRSFGQDAVTVDDDGCVRGPRDADEQRRAGKDLELLGKLALLETGEQVGTVTDVEFDPADGTIRGIITTGAELPGIALVGVGSYAAIFSAAD